jgi:hypothetical protein
MKCTHLGMVRTATPNRRGCEECLNATKHPIVTSLEPGETGSWCYVDEIAMELE